MKEFLKARCNIEHYTAVTLPDGSTEYKTLYTYWNTSTGGGFYYVNDKKFKGLLKFGAFSSYQPSKSPLAGNSLTDLYETRLPDNGFENYLSDFITFNGYGSNASMLFGVVETADTEKLYCRQNGDNVKNTTESVLFFGTSNNDVAMRDLIAPKDTATDHVTYFTAEPFDFENGQPTDVSYAPLIDEYGECNYTGLIGYSFSSDFNFLTGLKNELDGLLNSNPKNLDLFKNLSLISFYSISKSFDYSEISMGYYEETTKRYENGVAEFLENALKISTSESERDNLKNFPYWLEGAYCIDWMIKCCKAGKLVNDSVEDKTDYYVNVNENNTITFTWVNDYAESSESGYDLENCKIAFEAISYDKDLFRMTADEVVNYWFNYDDLSFPWNDKTYTTSAKDIIEIFDRRGVTNKKDNRLCVIMQGQFKKDNGVEVIRNLAYCEFDLENGKTAVGFHGNNVTEFSDTVIADTPPDDPNDPNDPNDPDEPPTPDNPIEPNDPSVNNTDLLTTTYMVTPTALREIGNFLWDNDWLSNLKMVVNNPIENIVSCKLLPMNISGGITSNVHIGNVDTNVQGHRVNSVNLPSVTSGELIIGRYFNSFLDYEPYTQIQLYLPFVGFTEIEPSLAYDGVMQIRYTYDVVNGALSMSLLSTGRTVKVFNTQMGVDIPLTGNNRAQLETGYLMGLVSGGIGVASGNPIIGAMSFLHTATQEFHSSTNGRPSSACGLSLPLTPYVLVSRPIMKKPTNFSHSVGNKCVATYTLNQLSGYTEIENVEFSAPCTEQEKNEIISLLKNGVYL